MPEDRQAMRQSAEFVHMLNLLKASHELYQEILSGLRDNVAGDGTPDLPALFRHLNDTLTDFAARDLEIRGLLARYEA